MAYLITQIVLCLALAAALGLLAGWAIWRRPSAADPDADARLAEREKQLSEARSTIRNLERKVATLHAEPTTHFPVPGSDDAPPPDALDMMGGPAAAAFIDDPALVEPVHETPTDPELASRSHTEAAASGEDEPPDAEPETPEVTVHAATAAGFPVSTNASPAYDDLKRISGIGATIEHQLAEIGITTYRQIAHFTDEDIERVGAHIDFFPDRIRREGWVVQAAALHRETYGTQP